jgi:hypothetical protein
MSKFTFQIVNNRGDESQLNLLLTATNDDTGLDGIELRKSTLMADFLSRNPSHSFSAEKLVSSRLYVGYVPIPSSPDPNSSQYYGWVEFSRNPDVDKGVWLNLSNVDIVGLPLTLKGKSADDGNPFSLGYKKSVKDIISDMKTRALTRKTQQWLRTVAAAELRSSPPTSSFRFTVNTTII